MVFGEKKEGGSGAKVSSVSGVFSSGRTLTGGNSREMQIFLVCFILVSLAEIFSIGGFIEDRKVLVVCRVAFSAPPISTDVVWGF